MEDSQFIKDLQPQAVQRRRALHKIAETGFALPRTLAYIKAELIQAGYLPSACGKAGLVVTVGQGEKCLLLRADIDGLPIKEKTGLAYACKTGNMHACGHDLHASMLLTVAQALKQRESKLRCQVKLLFQPAEEILSGAKDCIEKGVLQNPKVDGAMMLHVLPNLPFPSGTLIFSKGVVAPGADFFTATITGKSSHGASPEKGVDALSVTAKILIALESLSAREFSAFSGSVLTVGSCNAGTTGNVIAGESVLQGSLRSFDEVLRQKIKRRIKEIVEKTAKLYGAKGKVEFTSGCPALINDSALTDFLFKRLKKRLKDRVIAPENTQKSVGGSEDFAYFSKEIPSVMVGVSAGETKDGYIYPLHHPKVRFDEDAMQNGVLAFYQTAMAFGDFSYAPNSNCQNSTLEK